MRFELTKVQTRVGASRQVLAAILGILKEDRELCVGIWSTEIGDINELVILMEHPDSSKPALADDHRWIGEVGNLAKAAESLLCEAFPGAAVTRETQAAAICEMRTYDFRPSSMKELLATWTEPLTRRVALSPALAVMTTVHGDPRKLIHFWTYRSFEERMAMRKEASTKGYWPPPGGADRWLNQTTAILVPEEVLPELVLRQNRGA